MRIQNRLMLRTYLFSSWAKDPELFNQGYKSRQHSSLQHPLSFTTYLGPRRLPIFCIGIWSMSTSTTTSTVPNSFFDCRVHYSWLVQTTPWIGGFHQRDVVGIKPFSAIDGIWCSTPSLVRGPLPRCKVQYKAQGRRGYRCEVYSRIDVYFMFSVLGGSVFKWETDSGCYVGVYWY